MAVPATGLRQRIVSLRGSIQNYLWGKRGKDGGFVARVGSSGSDLSVKDDEHYAEIWFGTHQKGPSYVRLDDGECTLLDYLGSPLPYLLKILSINSVLSIQAHPDKSLASKLHKLDSQTYSDCNHKPEMVIALSESFEALCGFRPLSQIIQFVETIRELQMVIGQEESTQFVERAKAVSAMETSEEARQAAKDCVKQVFSAVMKKNNPYDLENVVKVNVESLITSSSYSDCFEVSLARRLAQDFPKDPGVFCAFFLNYINLKRGESLFIPPRVPHAYLLGEAIECMACSDNVVRAGLTPKQIHVNTLCDMLSYTPEYPTLPPPVLSPQSMCVYCPPAEFDEFQVTRIHVPAGKEVELAGVRGPSIVLVLQGRGSARRLVRELRRPSVEVVVREEEHSEEPGLNLKFGSSFLVPCSESVSLRAPDDASEDMIVYQASTNQVCFSATN